MMGDEPVSLSRIASIFRGDRRAAYSVLLVGGLLGIWLTFGRRFLDSRTYLGVMDFFLGQSLASIHPHSARFVHRRPLVPFLASVPAPLLGSEVALALVNSVFWVGTVIVLYEFTRRTTGSSAAGLWAGMLFNFSGPVLTVGAALLTDMPSWFFLALSLLLIVSWRKENSVVKAAFLGLFVGVGILARESLLVLLLAQALVLVFSGDRSWTEFHRFVIVILFSALPPVLWSLYLGESVLVYADFLLGETARSYSWTGVVTWEVRLYELVGLDARSLPKWLQLPLRWLVPIGGAFHLVVLLLLVRGRRVVRALLSSAYLPYLVALALLLLSRSFVELRLAFVLFPVILPLSGLQLADVDRRSIVFFALYVAVSAIVVWVAWIVSTPYIPGD
jgi:4-amino-4-deoxy-L-arabinose transferase-like glycosyltransferase